MTILKHPSAECTEKAETSVPEQAALKGGTTLDRNDMYRLGKYQSLQRMFGHFSTFAFSMILMSSWEVQLATATFGLTNGGTAGAIYIYIFTFVGFGMAIVSMAEMASMYGNGFLRLRDLLMGS